MFTNKTLLITGGTGSFGHAVLDRFLQTDVGEIRIFSRDEKKQDDMRKEYKNDKIKFYIGDVRDIQSVKNAIYGVDYIFHAAALKQVPSCEFFPLEAVKTNVIGTDNVLTAAINEGVKKVICLSTDKAAYPINAMGISKAMMEKVLVAKSKTVSPDRTTICGTRYGNVMASRGSVIPLFVEQIKSGQAITITDPNMTRFLMSLEEAVELVVFAFANAQAGDIMVQKSPASTIGELAQALIELFNSDNEIRVIGTRHGEKLYETLLTKEEYIKAKELGDCLIVGVTTENFDKARGKLLVQQSLNERIAAVKATGYADEVILEEYEGQKIDDIKKYGIDIFAIGSDWKGKFDYLTEYCKVVYLSRTDGVSSTDLRNNGHQIRIGVVGHGYSLSKFIDESMYISGIVISDYFFDIDVDDANMNLSEMHKCDTYDELLDNVDAVYIISAPSKRPGFAEKAIKHKKHVLCDTPISIISEQVDHLYTQAKENGVIFYEALKTAYSLAFQRLILLLKGGVIGNIKSVEATCTSLQVKSSWYDSFEDGGGATVSWGPYALFSSLKILGYSYKDCHFISYYDDANKIDLYTKIILLYEHAEATLKVGTGVKSEGDMIISGTRGYVYVPAPWWKMDYFEVRKEDIRENKRYFYQFEGEGIRYELAEFVMSIRGGIENAFMLPQDSTAISRIIENYRNSKNVIRI